jgi:RND family efflux transporter MFP subunit
MTLKKMKTVTALISALAISHSALSAELKFVKTEIINLPQKIEFDGTVEAVNRAIVASQTSGRILELPYDYGDFVEQGSVIARLTQSEQRAGLDASKASLNEAQTAYDEATRQLERLTALFERKLVAIAPVDTARQQRDAAKARLDAAKAQVANARARFDYTEVIAPYSGVVVNKLVSEGEAVQPGTPLIEGIALDRLRVRVQIPQANLNDAKQSPEVNVILGDQVVVPSEKRLIPTADPLSHTFTLLLSLPAGKAETMPLPGELARVQFVTDEEPMLTLPISSIATRGEVQGVYVGSNESSLQFRYIRTGQRAGDQVEITSGLTEGESVALDPIKAASIYKEANRAE